MIGLKVQAVRKHKYGAIGRHWNRRKETYQGAGLLFLLFLMFGIVGEMDYQDALLMEKYNEHVALHGAKSPFDPAKH